MEVKRVRKIEKSDGKDEFQRIPKPHTLCKNPFQNKRSDFSGIVRKKIRDNKSFSDFFRLSVIEVTLSDHDTPALYSNKLTTAFGKGIH